MRIARSEGLRKTVRFNRTLNRFFSAALLDMTMQFPIRINKQHSYICTENGGSPFNINVAVHGETWDI